MNFNESNIHPRDRRLTFLAESHTYYVDGEEFDSVTTVIDSLFEKFDAVYWSMKKCHNNEEKALKLRKEWDAKGNEAREKGTLMHQRIENYFLGLTPDKEALEDICFRHFLTFKDSFPLSPFRTEWAIFHEEARLAGTLDFLAFDGENYIIYDWKRSGKLIDSNGYTLQSHPMGKTGNGAAQHLPDTPLYHYALQLSLYRYILEDKYGIFPSKAFLGVFYPTLSKPYRISIPYLKDEAKAIISERVNR